MFMPDALRAAVREIMRGFHSSDREGELVAANLVRANMTAHDSHGIGMLPRYVQAFQEGNLKPNAQVSIGMDTGMLLALDGGAGFGQVVGREAMELGIERTREHGACIMALANAHHLGRIGEWAEMAVAEGLVSIHFVNVISRPIVAPWGGSDARFGTNPFAVGIPLASNDPIVLDFATSMIAQGKTRVAFNKGESLSPGCLLDDQGRPTTDPVFGVLDPLGALLPFGEHKGFGLSLVCELLGGALAGRHSVDGPADGKRRVLNGMLTILIDPSRIGDRAVFEDQARRTVDWIKASPPQTGVESVLIAGEPERRATAQRQAHGIPVDEQTWADILRHADMLGVPAAVVNRHVGL
jgi:uncharacterized oxidoreductase